MHQVPAVCPAQGSADFFCIRAASSISGQWDPHASPGISITLDGFTLPTQLRSSLWDPESFISILKTPNCLCFPFSWCHQQIWSGNFTSNFFLFLWPLKKNQMLFSMWIWKELAPLVGTCPCWISYLHLPSPPCSCASFSCCPDRSNLLHSLFLRIPFFSKARPNYPFFHLCSTFPSFPIYQLLPSSIFPK